MPDSETLLWSGSYPQLPPGGRLLGGLLLNPVTWPAYLAVLVLSFFSVPLWWALPLFIPHVFIVFSVALATLISRKVVLSAEFTTRHVVLTRRRGGGREVDIAELTTVAVEHFGSEGEGYTQTVLRLEWSRRITVAISIPGRHDATLAESLTRLLGRRIPETWHGLASHGQR